MRPPEVRALSTIYEVSEAEPFEATPECGYKWEAKRGPLLRDGLETVTCRSRRPHAYHTARTSSGHLRKRASVSATVPSWMRDPRVAAAWARREKRILEGVR